MTHRSLASAAAVGVLVAAVWLPRVRVAAQVPTTAVKPTLPAKTAATWKAPRTRDGQPDLQGFWNNSTYTPLERPKDVTKEFYTEEEALENTKRVADVEDDQTQPGTIPDVHYDFTQFGLDRSQGEMALNLRTSLIVDPANGTMPPMTAEGQKRVAARAEARQRMGAATDAAQNLTLLVRCMIMPHAGPPMLGRGYNNNYQIVQAPDYVMILVEMIHDIRIIPLDGRPHPPQNVRQWTGSSVGRWEGETLVVETRNFTDKTAFQESSEHMRVTERFTRVAPDTIRYQFTIDDPATWTRPWSAEVPWKKTIGPIFEHACHEGNYGLTNTLAGARVEEKRAAEGAAPKVPK